MYQLKIVVVIAFSPPVVEEPKEPVDPAVRAKENWLRLYNKVLEQLREVRSLVWTPPSIQIPVQSSTTVHSESQSCRPDSAPPCNLKDIPEFKRL